MSCSEESPYEETQLIGYSSSDSCVTRLRQYGNDSAEVEIEVDGCDINITHKNAILNCCLDSIEVELVTEGDTLNLHEKEAFIDSTHVCRCMCPYEVNSTIGVAEPGNYLLEIYTEGWYRGDTLVYQKWVEVP